MSSAPASRRSRCQRKSAGCRTSHSPEIASAIGAGLALASSWERKLRSSGRVLWQRSPVRKAPDLASRVNPAFSKNPRCPIPGVSAEPAIARATRVELNSSLPASRQVQHARRSSRVVRLSGSARSATPSPPIVMVRIAIALRPSGAEQASSVGLQAATGESPESPDPAAGVKAQSATRAEAARPAKTASQTTKRDSKDSMRHGKARLRRRPHSGVP